MIIPFISETYPTGQSISYCQVNGNEVKLAQVVLIAVDAVCYVAGIVKATFHHSMHKTFYMQ